MSFNYVLLGKKVREARESLLLSSDEVAKALKISKENYLGIETGNVIISADQIVAAAAFLKRDFRYFVTGDYPSTESQIKEMFRQNSLLSKNDRMAIQEFVRLCEHEQFLEEVLGIRKNNPTDYSEYSFGHNHFKTQGMQTASMERKRLHLGIQPLTDIIKILRDQGIRVFKRQLDDSNISGVYLRHPVAGHCVLINYTDDLYRQNFSAAHEYCHALFDAKDGQSISYLNISSVPEEWRANSFAGHFLCPKDFITAQYKPSETYEEWIVTILRIANRLQISSQVVIFRLSEIGWINDNLKNKLLNEKHLVISKNEKIDPELNKLELSIGTRQRLNTAISNGLSIYFLQLCVKAYQAGEITYHKALEMLFLPINEAISLLNDMYLFIEVNEQ